MTRGLRRVSKHVHVRGLRWACVCSGRGGDQLKAQVGDGEMVFAVTDTTALTLLHERQP
ncbi:hypothetical protein N9R09_02405 [Porticoccaceae bacterium]|nr:hypothetical protein [Porticoccaceae bacterium]